MTKRAFRMLVAIAISTVTSVRAETPEQWVTLGTRIHGFFGAYLPVGIRIGLDALKRLDAQPRGVTVVYHSGPRSPCPCPADGIAIATVASVGQGTLQVSPQKAPEDAMGVAEIRGKATGAGLKYTIPASWLPKLDAINKNPDALGRFNAVMNAPDLFTVELVPPAQSPAK
jgi:FmdE protein associated with molybdenum formylmethanofuran dehydrogenase